jgi:Asp-tRNA(Asn)/Glu-tRNA(Gln) amidotransferase A subunit family amidase
MASPEFAKVSRGAKNRLTTSSDAAKYYDCLMARDALMTNLLKVMADNQLDAIVHKSVEHQPTLIREGVNPPYRNHRGATHLNTFLLFVPSIAVPAGFTREGLPAGITFLGRPYSDGQMIRFAYAYEQATRQRRPPAITS